MTTESYFIAWTIYLISCMGMIAVWIRITRSIRLQPVRGGLRVLVVTLLLLPHDVGDGYGELAPSIIMVILETAFDGADAFHRVGDSLLQIVGMAMVGSMLYSLWLWSRRKSDNNDDEAASAALDEAFVANREPSLNETITPRR